VTQNDYDAIGYGCAIDYGVAFLKYTLTLNFME